MTRRRNRGGVLIEFALTVPFAVFLLLLTMDVGQIALASASLSDATAVSARAAARQGYVGPVSSSTSCAGGSRSPQNVAYNAFCDALLSSPIDSVTSFQVVTPRTAFCTYGDVYVQVNASAQVNLLTPGLGPLFGGGDTPLGGTITATGAARCEVARATP